VPRIDPDTIGTQQIGRMGELVVELELIARGWQVGNFNASTGNSPGWDVFAAREGSAAKIRVKAKRPGTECFRWSAKANGSVLYGLAGGDPTDFVAAVSFARDGAYDVYIVPSTEVEDALRSNHAAWLMGLKPDGKPRKDGSQRNLHLNDRTESPGHGYGILWERYKDAWRALEGGGRPA